VTTTTPDNLPAHDPDRPPSRRFAITAIVVTIVLLASMLALLLYRSLTQRAPSCVLIVQGDPRLDGALIDVAGKDVHVRYTDTLAKENKYAVTFFLNPGTYSVRVSDNQSRQVVNIPEIKLAHDSTTLGVDASKGYDAMIRSEPQPATRKTTPVRP
jgi:hypothetical protein